MLLEWVIRSIVVALDATCIGVCWFEVGWFDVGWFDVGWFDVGWFDVSCFENGRFDNSWFGAASIPGILEKVLSRLFFSLFWSVETNHVDCYYS